MELIFGFDIGTTSLGWAVIRKSKTDDEGRLLGLGTRIFPEARDPEGTPLNQQRRLARQVRRQFRRRRSRRRQLNELLADAALLPTFTSPDWLSTIAALDPYKLRSEGLTRSLTPYELGRAIYHLAKRRHFRGRDIEEQDPGKEEEAEEKEAKTGRETTIAELKKAGGTLGAYLAGLPTGKRKRGVHALRDHVLDEFKALLAVQRPHHSILGDEAFTIALRDAIFTQRPVFWRKNTLGECRLMPGSPLAPKASWASQQRRMLERLNNLAIAGGNQRPLEVDERAAILQTLQKQASMTWGGVRKILEPIFKARGQSAKHIRFNLEEGGNPKLEGNPLEAKLHAIFGQSWDISPRKSELRKAVDMRLRAADYGEIGQRVIIIPEADRRKKRKEAAASFVRDFGVSPEQASVLEVMTFPTGWDAYSTTSIELMLPELERGIRIGALLAGPEWNDWRRRSFPDANRPTGEFVDRIPSPRDKAEAERMRAIRNPTVTRTLNELRKITNNLIALHGKPELIRVEIARDVGLSKREREEKSKAMRKQEAQRKKAREDLRLNGLVEPSRRDIEKWLLWKECGGRDPYSGDMISFDGLFRNNEYEVEHIWPRNLSLDDSYANKTLCRRDLNLKKGNRLPAQAFGLDVDLWNAIKVRVGEMGASKSGEGMSRGKVRRFLSEFIPDDFASRQLNDTGYAAREAVSSLKRLWPDVGPTGAVKVQVVTGKVTAHLRRLWGLNNILADDGEKNREDHRHHAVDALVVACTDSGRTQKLARYWQAEDSRGGVEEAKLLPPWPSIRPDAANQIASVIVSHRVRKKVSGALHKGTIYGDTGVDEPSGKISYRLFTVRKPLENISKSEMLDIRDPAVARKVTEWVSSRGGEPKKAYPPYPRVSEDGPEIRKARILIKQQLGLMGRASTGYADLGANHHVAIFQRPDGKCEFEVVSLYEAARRLKSREPIVRREREGARFVMSLSQGDTLMFPEGFEKGRFKVVQSIWASGQVVTHEHSDASGETVWRPSANVILGMGVKKISVDPIGTVRVAHD